VAGTTIGGRSDRRIATKPDHSSLGGGHFT
jgi:hypothetical protein